mmetsp:Transcript_47372/g.103134  ORF Transcript_47372/g.103134 Transcript_47372/m.103134 type:complete len:248 (-) Transcript_47372:203-946(-)
MPTTDCMREGRPSAAIPLTDVHFSVDEPLNNFLVPCCSSTAQHTLTVLCLAKIGLHINQSLHGAELPLLRSYQKSRLAFKNLIHNTDVLRLGQNGPTREPQPVLGCGLQPLHCRKSRATAHLLPHLLCPCQIQCVPHLRAIGSNSRIQRGQFIIVREVKNTPDPLFLRKANHDLRSFSGNRTVQDSLPVSILGAHSALLGKKPVYKLSTARLRRLQKRGLLPEVFLHKQVCRIFRGTSQNLAGRQAS